MNIWMFLGLKTDNFSSSLKRARDESKGFEKDWKNLKAVFAAGGIAGLMIGFLKSFASEAQQTRAELEKLGQPIPQSTAALAQLGDSFDSVKGLAMSFVGTVVSGWQQLFDLEAQFVNRMRGISEAQENMRMAGARGVEEQEQRLAKAREENSPEKIAQAEQRLADVRRQAALDRASGEEKMNMLLAEHVRLSNQALFIGEHSIKGAKLREELEKNLVKISQLDAQLTKEKAAAQATADREAKQAAKERQQEADRLNKARFDGMTLDQQIETLAESESRQRANIADLKRAGLEITSEEADLQETINELARLRKDLTEQTVEAQKKLREQMEKQTEAARMTQRAYESIMFGITNGGINSDQLNSANDATLRDIISRNNRELEQLRLFNTASPISWGNNLSIARLENEIRRIEAELSTRDSLRRDVSFLGVEGARSVFKGDPLVFDRLVDQFVNGLDKTDQSNRLLEDIRDRLTDDPYTKNLTDQVRRLTDATASVAQRIPSLGLRTG